MPAEKDGYSFLEFACRSKGNGAGTGEDPNALTLPQFMIMQSVHPTARVCPNWNFSQMVTLLKAGLTGF